MKKTNLEAIITATHCKFETTPVYVNENAELFVRSNGFVCIDFNQNLKLRVIEGNTARLIGYDEAKAMFA